jgi:hypothetical protein
MAFGWTRSPATEAGGRGSTAEWERARGEGNRRVGGWDEREGAAAGTTPALGLALSLFYTAPPPSAAEKTPARATPIAWASSSRL